MRAYKEIEDIFQKEEYAKYYITFEQKDRDAEKVELVIDRCPDGCMPLWVKDKTFPEAFPWWHIMVYATDKEGYCWGRYNPQEKPEVKKDSKGKVILSHNVVNFDWVLPATEENRKKIIAEVSRLAFNE